MNVERVQAVIDAGLKIAAIIAELRSAHGSDAEAELMAMLTDDEDDE